MKVTPSFSGRWFNMYEHECKYDIAESFVPAFTVAELLKTCGVSEEEYTKSLMKTPMVYGRYRCGSLRFRKAVSSHYVGIDEDCVLSTHAGVGANHTAIATLYEQGDEIITVMPTYQQLRSYPDVIGANVVEYHLKKENNFCFDYDEFEKLVNKNTKIITLCNPNNPFGKLFTKGELTRLSQIAEKVGAYIICDEIYEGLSPSPIKKQVSICEVYDKGIVTSSMSKSFSLPGLRLGWIATQDKELIQSMADLRHFHTMECSVILEELAAIAIENKEHIINRNLAVVNENYRFFKAWIKDQKHLRFIEPDAGVVLVVEYDFDVSSEEFCKGVVEKASVMTMPGRAFGLPNCFRIGLTASCDIFEKALIELGLFIKNEYGE